MDDASDEDDIDSKPAWDADDPRRKADSFAPPKEPCECSCMHCGRTFSSDAIWFQRIINGKPGDIDGFWMCPTNNCGGAGFTFDIFPTDPEHPANAGWHYFETDDEEEFEEGDEAEGEPSDESSTGEEDEAEEGMVVAEEDDDDDDYIEEGDEWKLGYAPDAPAPPGIYGSAEMRAEQDKYDQPDERPRVIDASKEPPSEPMETDGIPF